MNFGEFEGISHNNSIKWVTQMLGCFCMCIRNWQLHVYWKQLPVRAAIISSSQTRMKLIQRASWELRYQMKMWLDCFICVSHYKGGALKRTRTLTKSFITSRFTWALQSFCNSWMVHNQSNSLVSGVGLGLNFPFISFFIFFSHQSYN